MFLYFAADQDANDGGGFIGVVGVYAWIDSFVGRTSVMEVVAPI